MLGSDISGDHPKVLFVCWGFPPSRGGGVYRGLALANGLSNGGFDVTVLTVERSTFLKATGGDTSLEDRIDLRVNVERIPFPWPEFDVEIDQWPIERVKDPRTWLADLKKNEQEAFPEARYGAWHDDLIAAAEALHRRIGFDLVIGTANPNVDLAVGLHLKRTYGIPYVADQRDAWRLNVVTEAFDYPDGTREAAIEEEIVRHADELWYVNEPIRAWHQQLYPQAADRMHVVMNGFDPHFDVRPPQPRRGRKPVRFGYLGTLTSHVPMADLLEGWIRAKTTQARFDDSELTFHGHLGFLAKPDRMLATMIDSASDYDVSYGGGVGKSNVAGVYESFDVLVFLAARGKYVTSGKIFEYMAAARPIVSVHEAGIAAEGVLEGYPLWFRPRTLSPDGIAEALAAAHEAAITDDPGLVEKCRRHAETFRRDRQFQPRFDHLKRMLSA